MSQYVAFCRVSGRSQENNNSLVNQRAAIEYWEKVRDDVRIDEWISVVEASTCFTDDRPKFKRALDLVRQPGCAGLIVYDLDRFFRNTEEGLRIARTEFLDKGKTLISINQNVDITTMDGWFMFGLFLLNAEREAKQISRRMRTGKEQKIRKHAEKNELAYLNGHPPYGWVSKGSKGARTLVADPFQQEQRQLIFSWINEGQGYTEIARKLTELNVPSPNGKNFWGEGTIRAMHKRDLLLAPLLKELEKDDERAS